MTHPTPEDLQSYKRRALASRELLAVDDHIAGCEECRRSVAADITAAAAYRNVLEGVRGEHLSYERIEQYVQRRLPADEVADFAAHAEMCPACAREIADLEEYAMSGGTRWQWWAVAAAAAVVIALAAFWPRDPAAPPVVRRDPPAIETRAATTSTSASVADPLQALSPSLQRVAKALESGALPSAALLASLHPPTESQRSGDPASEVAVRLLEPVGVVVESDRPAFRWNREEAVTVQIYDRSYALVAESPQLRGKTTWRVPVSLERGATYRWQLRVGSETIPAAPAPPAIFHVLGRDAFEELRAARSSGSLLEVGLISMREGLVAEGAQALRRYAAENPQSSRAAKLAEKAALLAHRESPPGSV